MKVASLFGLLEQLESNKIAVDQNRCVLVRNRNADCLRCAEACASGCISFDAEEARVVISPEKCIGCGTCATVCPTCALEAQDPTDSEFLRALAAVTEANEGEAVVACEQMLARAEGLFDPQRVVSVPCLGRVEESVVLALAAMGVHRVTLVSGPCAECTYKNGHNTANLVRETANELLETWGSDTRVRVSAKLPSCIRKSDDAGFDASRRAFFAEAKDEAKRAAATTVNFAISDALDEQQPEPPRYVKVQADGTLPHHLPNRRRRTLAALRKLGEPEDVMIGTRLWGHVIIDTEKCSSCQMCATFCPTGALEKFEDENGTFGVGHAPSACVKCRCCENICPEHAISISEEVFAVDLLEDIVERYEMKPRVAKPGNPHQMLDAMKTMVKCDQIYER